MRGFSHADMRRSTKKEDANVKVLVGLDKKGFMNKVIHALTV